MQKTASGLLVGLLLAAVSFSAAPPRQKAWWPDEVEQALVRAGDHRAELVKALDGVPADRRQGMAFLVAHMPERDLKSLRADFLLENVALAYKARAEVPWGARIPEAIFLNDVLPYANVDEERHPWRKELYELCRDLVKDCKTPGEAAQKLNTAVFAKLKVRYSTERKKPHQSPKESIELGKASCTGLSILLADACRSVAVPARLVGTPLWWNKRGNHTWVEVWDSGWHFTGACEQDPKGLDRGWFVGDAGQAKADVPQHAIYAASFKKTGLAFPLVWAPGYKAVPAENVTARYAKDVPKSALSKEQRQRVEKAAREFFSASAEERAKWKLDAELDKWLTAHESEVRRLVWEAYRAAPIHDAAKKDFDSKQVRHEKHLSPYTVKQVGKRPEKGWPLFIAMHGGGGVPKQVNDSQWDQMKRYYKDQPSVTGYLYVALRAPNDVWNGFYDNYVPPLVIELIRQFLLYGNVDADKVFLMGYSHGGYGAFFIGPKIPDRFAAVHCSAAAPTDGTISPKTLRNTRFTFMIGENDTMFGRRKRCEAFNEALQKLRKENEGDYPVEMEFKKGYGHGGLPDRDKIKEMYPFTRNPVPRRLTWEMTDPIIKDFFWLTVPQPGAGKSIDARVGDNTVEITTRGVGRFELCLDGRLIALDRPLRVVVDGKARTVEVRPRLLTLCRSLLERGDPELACTCRIALGEEKK